MIFFEYRDRICQKWILLMLTIMKRRSMKNTSIIILKIFKKITSTDSYNITYYLILHIIVIFADYCYLC